jgi:hypothetical protein
MPNRPTDLQPLSIASKRPRRPQDDQAHRMALLDATVLRWLHDAGWPQPSAFAHARAVEPLVSQWLGKTHPEKLFDLMPSLADRLGNQLPQSRPLWASGFISAFAHCLIARAVYEVALEARRAGHASIFASLRPYLHSEPTPTDLTDLGATLELTEAALTIALSRLRRRLRERIEAALHLWATSPETRNTLRRQLRESLIGTESTP